MQTGAPTAGADLFDLATQRLHWATDRERVLSQNIANADTPDYRPKDLAPFESHIYLMLVPHDKHRVWYEWRMLKGLGQLNEPRSARCAAQHSACTY